MRLNITAVRWKRAGILLGAIVGWALVFKAPFLFPPSQPTNSASYVFGFNNRLCLLAIGGLVIILTVLGRREALVELGGTKAVQSLPVRRITLALVAIYGLFLAGLSWVVHGSFYGEATYFYTRLALLDKGLAPYLGFEYLYGPTLIYPPYWLHRLLPVLSLDTAYEMEVIGYGIVGVWLLCWVAKSLFPAGALSRAFLVGLAVMCLSETLGANCSLLRFVTPLASLVALAKMQQRGLAPGWTWALAVLLPGVSLSLSPEIGLVYCAAQAGYFLRRFWSVRSLFWLLPAGLSWVCAAAFLIFMPEYFNGIREFSSGENNNPVLPIPHILLFLGALLVALPPLLREAVRGEPESAAFAGAFALLAGAMSAGALGSCDVVHVLFNGLPAFMLGFAVLIRRSRRWAAAFVVAFILVFAVYRVAYFRLYYFWPLGKRTHFAVVGAWPSIRRLEPQWVVQKLPRLADECSDEEKATALLLQRSGVSSSVLAPFGLSAGAFRYLSGQGRLADDYFAGFIMVGSPRSAARKIAQLTNERAVLVPEALCEGVDAQAREVEGRLRALREYFLYPFDLTVRNRPFVPWELVRREICLNFRSSACQCGQCLMTRREGQ